MAKSDVPGSFQEGLQALIGPIANCMAAPDADIQFLDKLQKIVLLRLHQPPAKPQGAPGGAPGQGGPPTPPGAPGGSPGGAPAGMGVAGGPAGGGAPTPAMPGGGDEARIQAREALGLTIGIPEETGIAHDFDVNGIAHFPNVSITLAGLKQLAAQDKGVLRVVLGDARRRRTRSPDPARRCLQADESPARRGTSDVG